MIDIVVRLEQPQVLPLKYELDHRPPQAHLPEVLQRRAALAGGGRVGQDDVTPGVGRLREAARARAHHQANPVRLAAPPQLRVRVSGFRYVRDGGVQYVKVLGFRLLRF